MGGLRNPIATWVAHRASALLAVLRLQPFELASAQGRSQERYRRIALSALGSMTGNGLLFAIGIVSVPITVGYLGIERYGAWMTMSSLVAALTVADLGIGNGLLAALARAHGQDDEEEARKLVSTSFVLLGLIGILLGFAFAVAYPFIPWGRIYNVSPGVAAEAGPASALLLACFLCSLPLGISTRVQAAYQEGYAASIAGIIGAGSGFLFLLLAIHLRASLAWLVLALGSVQLLSSIAAAVHLWGLKRRWIRPRLQLFGMATARRLLALGSVFVLLQVAGAVAFTSDNIVVAQTLGPQAVAVYSVASRLSAVFAGILQLFLMPLWPAYTEAISRGDLRWARSTLSRSLVVTAVISVAGACGLVLLGRPVIRAWVGAGLVPEQGLLLALGGLMVTVAVGNAISMFLNGAHYLFSQAVVGLVVAAFALTGKLWFAPRAGLAGMVWATVAAYLLLSLLPWLFALPRILSRLARQRVPEVQ